MKRAYINFFICKNEKLRDRHLSLPLVPLAQKHAHSILFGGGDPIGLNGKKAFLFKFPRTQNWCSTRKTDYRNHKKRTYFATCLPAFSGQCSNRGVSSPIREEYCG